MIEQRRRWPQSANIEYLCIAYSIPAFYSKIRPRLLSLNSGATYRQRSSTMFKPEIPAPQLNHEFWHKC